VWGAVYIKITSFCRCESVKNHFSAITNNIFLFFFYRESALPLADNDSQAVDDDVPLPAHMELYDATLWSKLPCPKVIRALLRGGAYIVVRTGKTRRTPLHTVITLAKKYCLEQRPLEIPSIVQLLIDAGADVNARDASGLIPLNLLVNEVWSLFSFTLH